MNKTYLHRASVLLIRAGGGRQSYKLRYLKHCFHIIVLIFFLILKLKHEKSYYCFSGEVQGQRQTTCLVNFLLGVGQRCFGGKGYKAHVGGR